jgi:hypothetical protein
MLGVNSWRCQLEAQYVPRIFFGSFSVPGDGTSQNHSTDHENTIMARNLLHVMPCWPDWFSLIDISGSYQKLDTSDSSSASTSCWPRKSWKRRSENFCLTKWIHVAINIPLDYQKQKRFGLTPLRISWKQSFSWPLNFLNILGLKYHLI